MDADEPQTGGAHGGGAPLLPGDFRQSNRAAADVDQIVNQIGDRFSIRIADLLNPQRGPCRETWVT